MGRQAAVALLILAAVAVFWNGLRGAFVFDDISSIRDNPLIRRLWPLSDAMSLPILGKGGTVVGRPILSLSFALNRALVGPWPWHYRIVNILIHTGAVLLLFGLVRRTAVRLMQKNRGDGEGTTGVAIAFGVALLWAVHPIQTASVTYIVQRAESLAGFFLLLTLYSAVRRFEGGGAGWTILAAAACLLGMGTKQIVFAAPALVLLYDWMFVSRGFVAAVRTRPGLYAGLLLGWVFLAVLVVTWQVADPNPEFGRNPWPYALTQPGVILYYLRLSFWPDPIVAVYAWPYAETAWRIVPPLLVMALLGGLTIWGVCRRSWAGFLGAWFFLILAPSSSFAASPLVIQCYRMYLPLAAVAVFVVVGARAALIRVARPPGKNARLAHRAAAVVLVLAAGGLAFGTIQRNRLYRDELVFWRDNVEREPESRDAHSGLAGVYASKGRMAEAEREFRKALEVKDSGFPEAAHCGLGMIELGRGRLESALSHFKIALEATPWSPGIHERMGETLVRQGDYEEAVLHLEKALELGANHPVVFNNLARALHLLNRFDDAAVQYQKALRLDPNNADIHCGYGMTLLKLRRTAEAEEQFREALLINPNHPLARANLKAATQEPRPQQFRR